MIQGAADTSSAAPLISPPMERLFAADIPRPYPSRYIGNGPDFCRLSVMAMARMMTGGSDSGTGRPAQHRGGQKTSMCSTFPRLAYLRINCGHLTYAERWELADVKIDFARELLERALADRSTSWGDYCLYASHFGGELHM